MTPGRHHQANDELRCAPSASTKQRASGQPENPDVPPERVVIHVVEIYGEFMWEKFVDVHVLPSLTIEKKCLVAKTHRRGTRHAGKNAKDSALGYRIQRHIARILGPGSHETHLAAKNVQ